MTLKDWIVLIYVAYLVLLSIVTFFIYLADKKKAKLITTEKDWVRLPQDIRKDIKYAKLETVLDPKFFDWLKEKLNCGQ